jgi:hypothetical protein
MLNQLHLERFVVRENIARFGNALRSGNLPNQQIRTVIELLARAKEAGDELDRKVAALPRTLWNGCVARDPDIKTSRCVAPD